MTTLARPIDFELPDTGVASTPAESRGRGRDDVKLMVTHRSTGAIEHHPFRDLARLLEPGDVLVVNNSATLPAGVDGWGKDGSRVKVHFASALPGRLQSVEVRAPGADGSTAQHDMEAQSIRLHGGIRLDLLTRHPKSRRLWMAVVEDGVDLVDHLSRHGQPIRYVAGSPLPVDDYQTVFSTEPGSAEMPSAGRPFTPDLVTRLVSKGVILVPVTLHAGVSSYEVGETPGEERYMVPEQTAIVVNAMRAAGGRVIAVGTTVVRALETVSDRTGIVHPGRGSTETLITAASGLRVVDGIVTGWHEPQSSHLTMLEVFLDRAHLDRVYREALATGYLWHEFGDSLLVLP